MTLWPCYTVVTSASIIWHWWHCQWNQFVRSTWLKQDVPWFLDHVMSVPWHLLVQDNQNEMWHDFFSHLTLLALASASCDANGTVVCNTSRLLKNVQHKFFDNLMPLMLVSVPHDANSFINGTIPFVRPRWLRWGSTWLFSSCDAISTGICINCCWWCHQWHSLGQNAQMMCNMTFLVSGTWHWCKHCY